MVDKVVIDGVRKTLAFHKTALQQRDAADGKDLEKVLADKAVINTELCKFQEDMQARLK